jgi:hypothetical protein
LYSSGGEPCRQSPYLWLCVALVVFGFAPPRTTVAADREDAVFSATEDHCGAEPHLEAMLRRDPDLAARRALVEQIILEAQQNGLIPPKGASTNANPTYTIPTVVHIIHTGLNGDPENISDNQVKSQIFAVNRDFRTSSTTAPDSTPRSSCAWSTRTPTVIRAGPARQASRGTWTARRHSRWTCWRARRR